MTSRSFVLPFVAAATLLLLSVGASRADLTYKTHTTINYPSSFGAAAASMSAMVSNMADAVTYISGTKMRVDSSFFDMITDTTNGKMTMLNPASKTYVVTDSKDFSTSNAGGVFSGKAMASMMSDAHTKLVTGGKPVKILGHPTKHYSVTLKLNFFAKPITMVEDIYTATDIRSSAVEAWRKTAGKATSGDITGIPLLTVARMSGGLMDGMTTRTEVTSISTEPVAASIFAIPDGYKVAGTPATPAKQAPVPAAEPASSTVPPAQCPSCTPQPATPAPPQAPDAPATPPAAAPTPTTPPAPASPDAK